MFGPGQARVNKLEEELTNALEVARVAEAAAARQIWCFFSLIELTFCATGFIPGQQCNCHGGEAGSLARGLQANVFFTEAVAPNNSVTWQSSSDRVRSFELQTKESWTWNKKRQQMRRTAAMVGPCLEGFVQIGPCGLEL